MLLVSKKGYQKLCQELTNLDNEILEVQKEMGKSAKRDNDLRENPEYMELRVKAMYTLPQRRQEIAEKLRDCRIIEETSEYIDFSNKVIPGSKIEFVRGGEIETFIILGEGESNLQEGIISYVSPLAQALLGKHINDVVNFNNMEIQIKSITKI